MKVAEAHKSSTTNHQVQTKKEPFFKKEGQNDFFTKPGNTTESFFSPATVQPKLKIGKPNDKYEVEADAVADKVVQRLNHSSTAKQDKSSNLNIPAVQAKYAQSEDEEKLQKKEDELSDTDTELQQKPIFESNAEQPDTDVQTKLLTGPIIQRSLTSLLTPTYVEISPLQ